MMTWRAVDEVAELRFPEHQRLGCGDAVAVLEAKRRELGQRAVVELERGQRAGQRAGSAPRSRRIRVVQHQVALAERAALGVLAGQADRHALGEQRRRTRALRRGPNRCRLRGPSAARRRSSCCCSLGCTVNPSGQVCSCSLSA